MGIELFDRDVLLVIDVQNDFCDGGALAVPGGQEVVPVINRIAGALSPCDSDPGLAPSRSSFLRLESSRTSSVRND
jgi:hypothetical protein